MPSCFRSSWDGWRWRSASGSTKFPRFLCQIAAPWLDKEGPAPEAEQGVHFLPKSAKRQRTSTPCADGHSASEVAKGAGLRGVAGHPPVLQQILQQERLLRGTASPTQCIPQAGRRRVLRLSAQSHGKGDPLQFAGRTDLDYLVVPILPRLEVNPPRSRSDASVRVRQRWHVKRDAVHWAASTLQNGSPSLVGGWLAPLLPRWGAQRRCCASFRREKSAATISSSTVRVTEEEQRQPKTLEVIGWK